MTHHHTGNLLRVLIRSVESRCAAHAAHRERALGNEHGATSVMCLVHDRVPDQYVTLIVKSVLLQTTFGVSNPRACR